MASQGQNGPKDLLIQKVWTFRLHGGGAFTLRFPGNPPLIHDSRGTTLWKMVGTEKHKEQIRTALQDREGLQVEVFTEEQTEEQTQSRHLRAQMLTSTPGSGHFSFQTKRCPECFFFDLELPNRCGIQDWDGQTLQHAMSSPKAYEDGILCPLNDP